jgi:hypothetical protein
LDDALYLAALVTNQRICSYGDRLNGIASAGRGPLGVSACFCHYHEHTFVAISLDASAMSQGCWPILIYCQVGDPLVNPIQAGHAAGFSNGGDVMRPLSLALLLEKETVSG